MSIETRFRRVVYCTPTECEVDVPNEFLTLFCRRCLDGTAMCTSWTKWSTDSPARPSPQARSEAENIATEAMGEKRRVSA